jgi:hypothetical protein
MAVTRTDRVKFIFQNDSGIFYEVQFAHATGIGFAKKHGATIKSSPMLQEPVEVTLTVDVTALEAWKTRTDAYRIQAADYNGGQRLAALLNGGS